MNVRWILIAGLVAGFGCSDTHLAEGAADSGTDSGGKGSGVDAATGDAGGMGVDAATDDAGQMAVDAATDDAGDMAEVSYTCDGGTDGVFDGSYTIKTPVDAAAFAGCTTITGDLTVDGWGVTSLSLPALTTVGGDFQVNFTPWLTNVSVPVLTTIDGAFLVHDNSRLTTLVVPGLSTVGGAFQVYGNLRLTSLSVPMLTTVGGDFLVGRVYFVQSGNAVLTSLSFPVLTKVGGDFYATRNTSLETSLAQALRDQLTASPPSTTICGNKNGTACP